MQLTSKDLRFHTKSALDAVKRGEQVEVTYHGKVVALMVPPHNDTVTTTTGVKDVPGFGIWSDRKDIRDTDQWLKQSRKPRYKL